MKRFIAVLLIICNVCMLFAGCSFGSKKLTVMMYVVGSNLENDYGCATEDFNEIFESSLNLNKVNYIICTGGSLGWKSDIPNSCISYYKVIESGGTKKMEKIYSSEQQKDMGSPEQLSDFLNYSYENYPAEQFGLICWNHGGGPNQGFGYDENFEDFLELNEFSSAFEASPFKGENRLSWIGFDACLMGSIEIGDSLKNYADYMIASQELEPGSGWDYSFLSDIDKDYSAEGVAKSCIDTFYSKETSSVLEKSGSANNSDFSVDIPVTLSCVDLQKIGPLNDAVDAFFASMNTDLSAGKISYLVHDRMNMYNFGINSSSFKGTELDLVDIGQLAEGSSLHTDESDAVISALKDYVVYQQSGINGVCGVSIYYPFDGVYTFLENGGKEAYTGYRSSPGYVNYIKDFTDQCYRDVDSDDSVIDRYKSSMKDVKLTDDKITLELTDEEKKTFSRAYVNILRKISESEDQFSTNDYTPILLDCQVDPDSDGNITIDSDISVPVQKYGSEISIWPMRQVSKNKDESRYQTLRTLVITAPEEMPYTAWEHVSVNVTGRKGSDSLDITGINYVDENSSFYGKNDVDIDNWNFYANMTTSKMLKYEDDGSLKPYSEWNDGGTLESRYSYFSGDTQLEMVPLSLCEYGDYYYQIVIEDIHGNNTASDLFVFTKGAEFRKAAEKTEKGEAEYHIFSDHVEFAGYSGNDEKFTVPSEYENHPVTVIKQYSFGYNAELEEVVIENPDILIEQRSFSGARVKKITLPDGIKKIPYKAFFLSDCEEISIPSSVKTIERYAFAYCDQLKSIVIPSKVESIAPGAFAYTIPEGGVKFDGESSNYMIKDDFLLSKDGKLLYSRFKRNNECDVPEGVEEIMSWGCVGGVFYSSDDYEERDYTVKSVSIPDSVRIINSDAFRGSQMKELNIPDSVVYIGHNAFANYNLDYDDPNITYSGEEAPEHVSLYIGKGLSWLGKEVLGYNSPVSVTVSEDNKYYSADGDRLMNKAGDCEIELVMKGDYDKKTEYFYKALEYLRSQIDMSDYKAGSYTYEFEGQEFSDSYTCDNAASANINTKVTLGSEQFELPCKVSDMLDKGFKYYDPSIKDVKISGKSESGLNFLAFDLEDPSGNRFEVTACNMGDSEIPASQAKVRSVTAKNKYGMKFEANGVSCTNSIKEVIDKLGKPNISMYLYDDNGNVRINLHYQSDSRNTITQHVTYLYNINNKKLSPFSDTIDLFIYEAV